MFIKQITDWLSESGYSFSFEGKSCTEVSGFASLEACESGKITWVKKQENYEKLADRSDVSVAVVQEGLCLDIPNKIVAANSKEVFFAILHHFWGAERQFGFIGKGTFISEEAEIDPSAYIGYNCSIVGDVKIGANTIVENNVTLCNKTVVGNDCIIHSGAVIGADGFGFSIDNTGLPTKVEHFGGVSIGNRVEIGANTCIDRGTIDDTVIGDDVKIDNLVHIAHNVLIEKGAMVVAGAIVCGSAKLGRESYIAPGGIVKNQLQVGNNALIGLGAVVTKPVSEASVVTGVPAREIRKVQKGDK